MCTKSGLPHYAGKLCRQVVPVSSEYVIVVRKSAEKGTDNNTQSVRTEKGRGEGREEGEGGRREGGEEGERAIASFFRGDILDVT